MRAILSVILKKLMSLKNEFCPKIVIILLSVISETNFYAIPDCIHNTMLN